MALNAAEEETLEALKTWWNEQGRRLAVIVILLFGGYTAWLVWQNANTASAEAASDLYEEILNLSLEEPGALLSAEDSARVIAVATQLCGEYTDSPYASYAAMFAAQQEVQAGNLDAAEQWLSWVLESEQGGLLQQADSGLRLAVTLRLGRVLLAKGETDAALATINSVDPQDFEAGFAELRGDIYLAMDRIVDAREAYQAAQQAGSTSDGLRMKLESISGPS